MPIARAMPSSPRLSAASITKIRKISKIPAAIENEPKVVKSDMNDAPAVSAVSSASCFVLSTSRPSGVTAGFSRATTASVCATPPRFTTMIARTRPGWWSIACAAASGISSPDPEVAPP